MNLLATLMVVVLALQAACDDPARPETQPADPVSTATPQGRITAQQVRVTRDGQRGPAPCSPEEVGELIVGFFGAINEGAVEASSFFAPDMEWYSVSEWSRKAGKHHFVSYGYEPEKLQSYFERRISQHERLHLLEIEVAYERSRELGHVVYAIERTANDLPNSDPIVIGKGAIDCDTGTIAVWSMSHDTRFQRAPVICPGEADPPKIAVACARASADGKSGPVSYQVASTSSSTAITSRVT